MPDDILTVVLVILGIVSIGICLAAAYRAVEIGRGLVSRVHRNRAFWTAAMLGTLMIGFSDPLPGTLGVDLGMIAYVLFLLLVMPFVDGAILAAEDTDFFHRDTLQWRRLRRPVFVVYYIFYVILLISTFGPSTSPIVSFISNVSPGLFIIPGYAIAALVLVARRTADRNLKWYVGYLGLGLAWLVGSVFLYNPSSVPSSTAEQAVIVVGLYFFYRAVMSLSPLGRVEEIPVSQAASPASPLPAPRQHQYPPRFQLLAAVDCSCSSSTS